MKKCNGHLGLAKVDFQHRVPHLDFHFLNQLANVCDVRVAVINRLVGGLDLDEHNDKSFNMFSRKLLQGEVKEQTWRVMLPERFISPCPGLSVFMYSITVEVSL